MKKHIVTAATCLLAGIFAVNAQNAPAQGNTQQVQTATMQSAGTATKVQQPMEKTKPQNTKGATLKTGKAKAAPAKEQTTPDHSNLMK